MGRHDTHPGSAAKGPRLVGSKEFCELDEEELTHRAYHEAGHVIEAWETPFPPTECTVETGRDEEDGQKYDGRTKSAAWDCREHYPSNEKWLDSHLVGEIAESLGTGVEVPANSEEYSEAQEIANRETLDFKEAEARVRRFLEKRRPWLEIVAQELKAKRTLDESELQVLRGRCPQNLEQPPSAQ